MSQIIHEANITLITKHFVRRYNCRPFINPRVYNHFVSLLSWTPSLLKGPEIRPQITCGYGFVFSICRTSASTTILGLPECVFHRDGNPHNILCFRGPNSQRRRCGNESMAIGSIGHITYHTTQKQAASGSWDGLLKAQLKHQ